ncbi:uncharacterized protein HMPREF1120_08627 [Exophiala dermatitidis NIH/UT8656]|uniref:Uncharacterized protein n=1 Tax=Exophiala dermatitidis (strain ATCC 34100 / CBS 525.76 / NIH/UT8656) TaxID=858893 RepID=H6C9A8_EXODN|nr:uncharacterized protein HMPREF1120_08627 [Exophiala dermatitidis NIH/UT8656]EHY60677.1 hypothetical protein HMPREF1120_08627 [Exophiala dermatitidis NIH/UT8656]
MCHVQFMLHGAHSSSGAHWEVLPVPNESMTFPRSRSARLTDTLSLPGQCPNAHRRAKRFAAFMAWPTQSRGTSTLSSSLSSDLSMRRNGCEACELLTPRSIQMILWQL